MWETLLNQKIVVFKTDGYTKYGILKSVEYNFIFIEYEDGTLHTIRKEEIKDVKLFQGAVQ